MSSYRYIAQYRSLIIVTVLLATVIPCASATTFYLDYDGLSSFNVILSWGGTHYFQVDGIPQYRTTKWYVNGVFQEEDTSGFFAIDPQLKRSLSGPENSVNIRAEIFDSNGSLDRKKYWGISVKKSDLVVTALTVSAWEVKPGDSVRVDASVKNIGEAAAPRTTIEFRWIEASDTVQLATGYIPNIGQLDVDEVSDETASLTIPASPPGYYYLRARADWDNAVWEEYENNNTRETMLRIPGDVTVSNLVGSIFADLKESNYRSLRLLYGLIPGQIMYENSETAAGVVIGQSLEVGEVVPVGTPIGLTVSLGPSPTIRVRTPKKGEVLLLGGKRRIKWRSSEGLGGDVRIELWQNGSKVRNIKESTPNDGRFKWRIRSSRYAVGTDYRVRIVSLVDPSIEDFSKGTFSIVSSKEVPASAESPTRTLFRADAQPLTTSTIAEEVLPLSVESAPETTTPIGAPIAIRLSSSSSVDRDTISVDLNGAPLPGESAQWRPTVPDDDRDGWVIVQIPFGLNDGDMVSLTVRALTQTGSPIEPRTESFRLDTSPYASDGPEIETCNVDGRPARRLSPAGVYTDPVTVQLPLEPGQDPDATTIAYYSESDRHMGWYASDQVTGWLVPDSRRTVTVAGLTYIEFQVNHSGVMRLDSP